MDKAALASLRKLRDDLTKTYGPAVTRQDTVRPSYDVISTGSVSLDYALGVGGIVMGRIALYWGPEGVGKTTAAIMALAEAQQGYPDRIVGYIDMEQTFDWEWAEKLGLDTSETRFLHIFPDSTEDVADQLKKMVMTGLFSLVVVDSLGGMISKVEMEKDAEESAMGKNAQAVTRMSKMCAVVARKNKTAILLISQVRALIGASRPMDTYAGTKSVRHSISQRVKFSRTATPSLTIKNGDSTEIIGVEVAARVERSKVAAVDGRVGKFFIISRTTDKWGPAGIDRADEVRALVDLLDLVPKSGSHYNVREGLKLNGKDAFKEWLRANPDEIEKYRDLAVTKQAHLVEPETEVQFEFEDEEE